MKNWTFAIRRPVRVPDRRRVVARASFAGGRVRAWAKEAKVHGTFKAFKIVNPHSSMKIDVKNKDGSVTEWTFVGGSVDRKSRGSVSRTRGTECASRRR